MISKRVLYCVLTTFLVAIVLTGTAVAGETRTVENGSTVFVYENISLSDDPTALTLMHYTQDDNPVITNIISSKNGVFSLNNGDVNGNYGRYYYNGSPSSENGKYIEIYYPEITLKAELVEENGENTGNSIDGKSINKKTNITFIIEVPTVGTAQIGATAKIVFKTPDGRDVKIFGTDSSGIPKDYSVISLDQAQVITGVVVPGKNSTAGTWTAQAEFVTPASFKDAHKSNTISFTVTSTTLIITAARDSVIRSNPFTVTISGEANTSYNIYITNPEEIASKNPVLLDGQDGYKGVIAGINAQYGGVFETSTSGMRTVQFSTDVNTENKTYTIRVEETGTDPDWDEVKVKVEKGAVTMSASGDGTYYIGEEITLSGTNTDSDNVFLFITGPNLDNNGIVLKDLPEQNPACLATNPVSVKSDNTWEYKWNTSGCALDTGAYTIYATSVLTNGKSTEANGTAIKLADATYVSTLITLKHPTLTIYTDTDRISQGDSLYISGICEKCLSNSMTYYLVGPETFLTDTISVDADGSYHTSIRIGADSPSGIYHVVTERPTTDGSSDTQDEEIIRSIIAGTTTQDGRYAIVEFTVGAEPVIPPASPSGAVTIHASSESLYLGETITFTGSNTKSNSVYLFITGPNLDPYGYQLSNVSKRIKAGNADGPTASVDNNKWEYTWNTSNTGLDIGTYTIYATDRLTNGKSAFSDGNAAPILSAEYASTTVEIKMPYFTMIPSAYYVQKNEILSIKGNATGNPQELAYYLFGPNTYLHATTPVQDNGSYEIIIPTTSTWSQNQYYLIIEHPMYNNEFNIIETKMGSTTELTVKYPGYGPTTNETIIVEGPGKLQGVNAADALTKMIDSANIDDVYGKYTFIVYDGAKPLPNQPTDDNEIMPQLTHEIIKSSCTPSGNLKVGESATAVVDIEFKHNTTSSQILLESGLKNQKWSGTLSEPWGSTLTLPADISYVDGWLLSGLPTNIILHLTVTGTVPDTIGKEISQLRITEIDSSEKILFHYTSPKQLIIREGTDVSATLALSKGWNFISIPKTLSSESNSAEKLFAYVNTSNHQILGYDAQISAWKPVQAKEIIRPLTGYWVYAEEPISLMLSYTNDPSIPSTKEVYPGWNAVGLSADTETNAINAFAGTTWIRAIPWNLSKGSYGTAITNGGVGDNDPSINLLQPGWGYWLYVQEQGTITGMTV